MRTITMPLQNTSAEFPSSPRSFSLTVTALLISFSMGMDLHASEPSSPVIQAPTNAPIPSSISREIAEIQRQLGGSIVTKQQHLPSAQPMGDPPSPPGSAMFQRPYYRTTPYPVPSNSPIRLKIETLRNAASNLDAAASSLESAELYAQADNLRKSAQDFRLEARKLRIEQGQPTPDHSSGRRIPTPSLAK